MHTLIHYSTCQLQECSNIQREHLSLLDVGASSRDFFLHHHRSHSYEKALAQNSTIIYYCFLNFRPHFSPSYTISSKIILFGPLHVVIFYKK
jgi:hypothetical protein